MATSLETPQQHAASRIYEFAPRNSEGPSVPYTLRGLSSDKEVEEWTEFCASVFAYKKPHPPAPFYFSRHFYNDPDRDVSLIRVALYNTSTIVASCRVFRRCISLGEHGKKNAGGIGEVCTSEHHRRRGLSSALLKDATDLMDSSCYEVSFLHSAPAFFPVYEKAGYKQSLSSWQVVSINGRKMMSDAMPTTSVMESMPCRPSTIRQASFPKDVKQMMKIHQSYSERRFVGCIIRSEAYWTDYIAKELEGSLWVLEQEDEKTSQMNITAWMSLRSRGDGIQLREFGCDTGSVCSIQDAVVKLLHHIVNLGELSFKEPIIQLRLPPVVYEESKLGELEWVLSATEENDYGWMYRGVEGGAVDVPKLSFSNTHLIWPSDGF